MVAVGPVLHEIIPHGWSRTVLLEHDATISSGYSENPATGTIFRERMWHFMEDPSSPGSLWTSAFHANGIGWTLHLQGRGWRDSGWYRQIEAPLDSCWILDAMIGDASPKFALAHLTLTRPRGARPFTVDDVQRLDRLRPWLAHALRWPLSGTVPQEDQAQLSMAGPTVLSGQLILATDARLVHQTSGLEFLLRILAGAPGAYTRYVPIHDRAPAPILKLLRQLAGAAGGTSNTPPRMQISTAYGVVTLEAKWLVPAADVAKDPKSCLIAVTIELHEHAIAHATRVLRESGATPTQTKVGIQLAFGKPKPAIANELGLQFSSVADHSKKLYLTLDVHNSTELATKIWLGQRQGDAQQNLWHAG